MNLIIKIATYAFLAGLIFTGTQVWDMFKERNVNQTPIGITIDEVKNFQDELTYAAIDGGQLDIINTYEHSVQTKRSNVKLSSTYYTPVIDTESMSAIYIVKSDVEPTIDNFLETPKYQGLLQSKDSLPDRIKRAYDAELPNQNYFYLDTSYEPKTFFGQIQDLGLAISLLFGGLFVRIFAKRAVGQPVPQSA